MNDLKSEDILSQVKDKLNKNNIKLWLEPYYCDNKGVGPNEEQALQVKIVPRRFVLLSIRFYKLKFSFL